MRYARAALVLAALLVLTPCTHAQQADAQAEARALQTMQDALGPMVEAATRRIALMKEYVGDNGLEQAWTSFTPPPSAKIKSLSFDKALDAAMRHQRLLAPATPNQGAADVGAMQNLVKSQWQNLGNLHQQVANLSAFLTANDKLDAYKQWAMDANTPTEQQPEPETANQPETGNRPGTAEQRQIAAEKLSQQRYNNLLAGFQEQLDQEQQAQQNANDDPDDDQDYYEGSYWNGYADPYYDVYGVPALYPYRWHGNVPGPYWWHDCPHPWDRNNGLLGHAAPVAAHPAVHVGRR